MEDTLAAILRFENGATLGYEAPQYWRITVHGVQGVAEIRYNTPAVQIATDTDTFFRKCAPLEKPPSGYLQDFLDEIAGTPAPGGLTTEIILTASCAMHFAPKKSPQSQYAVC